MIILKPVGRGNWRTVEMQVTGAHVPVMLVKRGDRITLAGVAFRVCRVLA
jgi:hypothetical protein